MSNDAGCRLLCNVSVRLSVRVRVCQLRPSCARQASAFVQFSGHGYWACDGATVAWQGSTCHLSVLPRVACYVLSSRVVPGSGPAVLLVPLPLLLLFCRY